MSWNCRIFRIKGRRIPRFLFFILTKEEKENSAVNLQKLMQAAGMSTEKQNNIMEKFVVRSAPSNRSFNFNSFHCFYFCLRIDPKPNICFIILVVILKYKPFRVPKVQSSRSFYPPFQHSSSFANFWIASNYMWTNYILMINSPTLSKINTQLRDVRWLKFFFT